MGNYTIRTTDQDDAMIRDVAEYMGLSSVSKAFMLAISQYKQDQDRIFRLERELEKEKARSQLQGKAISDFETSMTRLFELK